MTIRRAFASLLLALGLAGLLASPGVAFAQRSDAGISALKFLDATAEKGGLSSGIKGEGFSSEDAVLGIIGNIVNVILGFVGIIFFIQMFYAGFRWMSSGGNEEVVTESRQTIKSAVIGIVIVFAAFVVTNFVLNQIASITGPTRPSTPFGETAPGGNVYCRYLNESVGLLCQITSQEQCEFNQGDAVSLSECEAVNPLDTDPSLDIPGGPPGFGDLPPPLGTCIYPKSDECAAGNDGWTDLQSDISESACSTLAAQACGDPDLYDWL